MYNFTTTDTFSRAVPIIVIITLSVVGGQLLTFTTREKYGDITWDIPGDRQW